MLRAMAYLRIFIAVILIHFVYVIVAIPLNVQITLKLNIKKRVKAPNICKSEDCNESAKELLDYIDLGADPCSDFFNFTCGNYINKELPETLSSKSTLSDVRLSNTIKLKDLLEEPISKTEPYFIQQTKVYYKYCKDKGSIDEFGLENMQKELRENFGGWPITEDDKWNEEQSDLTSILIKLQMYGVLTIFKVDIRATTQREQYMIMLEKPDVTFPKGSYNKNLQDGWLLEELNNFILNVSLHFGKIKYNEITGNSANDILQFEENIVQCTRRQPKSAEDMERSLFLDLLKHMFKNVFNFEIFIKTIFKQVNIVIESDERIGIFSKPYFQCLSLLMQNTPKRDVVNYLLWKMIEKSIITLPSIFMEMENNFRRVTNMKQALPRLYECIERINEDLHQFLAHMYVKKHFNSSTKKKVLEFIHEIKKAFRKLISYQKWLEPETRAEAISKLDQMRDNIGYPEHFLDEKRLNDMFNEVDLNTLSFLDAFYIPRTIKMKEFLKPLRSPVDIDTMDSPVTTTNAFYQPMKNKIVLPAGVLTPPFFSDAYPMYLNFGAIGAIIGHEISHGFDYRGSQYDQDGIKRDWWQNEDRAKFTNSSACLINQYNRLVYEPVNEPANGNITLNENMADAGGLRIAYMAYKQWLRKHGEEVQLPGIPYNSEQMFFIAYGRALCSKFSDVIVPHYMKESIHSMSIFRVNTPLKNLRLFSKAFKCKPSSVMNPTEKCRIW